jgi:hypothetical protein
MVEKEKAKREKEELLAREEAEIKRRMEKEAKEAEERIALYKLQEQELHMKQIQWEWQKSQDARERERQQTPAAQIKFFGNVLKNVMPKFPTDVADALKVSKNCLIVLKCLKNCGRNSYCLI